MSLDVELELKEYKKLVTVEDEGDFVIVRPKKYLGDVWHKVNAVLWKKFNAEWIKLGKMSHWRIPLKNIMKPNATPPKNNARVTIEKPRGPIPLKQPQKPVEPKKMKITFELSPFNINIDFKDPNHIDLLKKQITAGHQLEIVCYEEIGKLMVIDGGHTLEAYNQLNIDPQQAKITIMKFESDADKIAFSRHRNINRLQQTPVTLTNSICDELKIRFGFKDVEELRKALHRAYRVKHNEAKNITEDDRNSVKRFTEFFQVEPIEIKFDSFAKSHIYYLDFPIWLAEMVDKGELKPTQAQEINREKLRDNEALQRRIAEICIEKELRWTIDFIKEVLNFEPQKTAFWHFLKSSDIFGDCNYPGRCNGELVRNVLHFWTKENDLVVDPMAGSGTTNDVSKLMNRKYLAYDIKPYRDDIKKYDIRKGFPPESKGCQLIFLDPPYYKKKEKEYSSEEISENKEVFLKFMEKLAKDCFDTLGDGGICALLVSDYFASGTREIILSCEYWSLFKKVGFKDVMRVTSPLPLASLKATWPEPEENIHALLDVNRDLYIFRK